MNYPTTDLQRMNKNIYAAQCIGNVEPIEYMIPYPSMSSLIEGQNIKYSSQTIIAKPEITNLDFFNYIQKTANWLESIGIKPRQPVTIPKLQYPQSEILIYGIWQIGAVGVVSDNMSKKKLTSQLNDIAIIPENINLFDKVKLFSNKYNPKYKPNLSEEALITFETGNGIKLSHYNLLVNTNCIQKALNLKSRTKIYCDIEPYSSSWVVFKAILPIYSGCIFDEENPDLNFNTHDGDYIIRYDFKNIDKFSQNEIAVCPENTAAISIGKKPIHLTDFLVSECELKLKGHSVMMGYLDKEMNTIGFKKKALFVSF